MIDTTRAATTAVKKYKKSNPLLVRKKMALKEVYFRKNEPEREVFRLELAFDTEQYVIVALAVCILVMLCCFIRKTAHRCATRRMMKHSRKGI
ncbi:MAG: hypothetical protein E7628_02145 [Ruminococcaceae bacterium]|nr:hypothetical protein [Oscillospiraceae bacterium]